jgi:hypothetical protein
MQVIDVLAHNSLVKDSHFQSHLVSDEAARLSAALYRTLSPLVPEEEEEDEAVLTMMEDTEDEKDAPIPSPTALFHGIFMDALILKAKLLATRRHFKAVFAEPNMPYDPAFMKRDGWSFDGYSPVGRPLAANVQRDASRASTPLPRDERVKICLFPAIYGWPPRPPESRMSPASDSRSYLVDYDNFLAPHTAQFDTPGAVLVCKAVVLTRNT